VTGIAVYSLAHRKNAPLGYHLLTGPLGYWNALGILSAISLLLAAGFATGGFRRELRLVAAAAVPLLAVVIYLTHSRASLLGLAGGLFVGAFLHPWLGRRRRAAAVAVAVVALAVVAIAAARAGGPGALLGKTYGAFRAAPAARGASEQRILTISGNFRTQYWHVAWLQYRAHPWLGTGAGTFDMYWDKNRNTIYGALDAHDLYLETLAELGPIGLLLLAGTLALPFVALRGARRDSLLAAAVGGYIAFLVHATFDWDWEIPAVTMAGLFCGAGVVALAPGRLHPVRGPVRAGALGVLAVLAAFALVTYRGNSAQDDSVTAAAHGKFVQADTAARTAARWLPWASEPWRLRGEAQLGLGQLEAARSSFRTALDKDPRDWKLWFDLALATKGDERRHAIDEASRLNRYSLEVRSLRGE
jgi:hypothetical protein